MLFLYWSFTSSASTSYGDIIAVTPVEKLFQVFALIIFRVYLTFIVAEFSNILSSIRATLFAYLEKIKILEDWLKLHKMSP